MIMMNGRVFGPIITFDLGGSESNPISISTFLRRSKFEKSTWYCLRSLSKRAKTRDGVDALVVLATTKYRFDAKLLLSVVYSHVERSDGNRSKGRIAQCAIPVDETFDILAECNNAWILEDSA